MVSLKLHGLVTTTNLDDHLVTRPLAIDKIFKLSKVVDGLTVEAKDDIPRDDARFFGGRAFTDQFNHGLGPFRHCQ